MFHQLDHKDDLALCCWCCTSAGEANSCQKDWSGVIMDADKTGIPQSASGHHDDSSLCNTLRRCELRDDRRWVPVVLVTGHTTAGRRWWQTLFSSVLYPRPSFLSPSSPAPLPSRSAAAVLQNKSRDKCRSVSVSMDTRGLLQRLPQSLFTHTIVLGDNGSQTPPPSSSLPLHTTRLSRVSWQMLTEACTYIQNTLCLHL